jgi:hypothetical protein
VICGQCNKSKHSKEHWNPKNPNNKFKDKKKVVVNGVSTQPGEIGNKYGNNKVCGEANESGSIIYSYFIYNFVKHKIYHYLYKDAAQVMFKKKEVATTRKKDDVAISMVLAITTHSTYLKMLYSRGKTF